MNYQLLTSMKGTGRFRARDRGCPASVSGPYLTSQVICCSAFAGEALTTPSLNDPPTREASAMRKRLLEAFAQYDALSKRIYQLPGPDGSKSSQFRVQAAVLSRASIFLQKNMFPLKVTWFLFTALNRHLTPFDLLVSTLRNVTNESIQSKHSNRHNNPTSGSRVGSKIATAA